MSNPQPLLLCGSAHPAFAQAVAKALNLTILKLTNHRFADGEIRVELHDNVRNREVFILQPTCPPVNDNLMELALLADTLKRSSASGITAVMPYFGYARQDRKAAARAPVSAKLIANLLTTAGVERVLTMDLHAMQIQGFFDIPVDHLYASPVFEKDIRSRYSAAETVVVSPDAGGMSRARALANRLDMGLAMVDKRRDKPNEVSEMRLIGDVAGKTCLVFDDMVDTAGTIAAVANTLKENGATNVVAYVTHGLFSDPAPERLTASAFDEFVVTDSVPLRPEVAATGLIRQITVAPYFAEAIRRVMSGASVSSLYNDFPENLAG